MIDTQAISRKKIKSSDNNEDQALVDFNTPFISLMGSVHTDKKISNQEVEKQVLQYIGREYKKYKMNN